MKTTRTMTDELLEKALELKERRNKASDSASWIGEIITNIEKGNADPTEELIKFFNKYNNIRLPEPRKKLALDALLMFHAKFKTLADELYEELSNL